MSVRTRDTVWIPAVPLPMLGWRHGTCQCGRRFRLRHKGDLRSYDVHWLARHTTWPAGPEGGHGHDADSGWVWTMQEVPREEAARLAGLVQQLRSKPNAARVLGPLIFTSCLQGTGAPLLDDCFVGDAEGRRYHGKALHLRPWRRNQYGERLRARALVVGWRE